MNATVLIASGAVDQFVDRGDRDGFRLVLGNALGIFIPAGMLPLVWARDACRWWREQRRDRRDLPLNPRVSLSLNPSGDRVGKPARLQPRKFAVVAQRRKRAVDRLDASGLEVVKRSRDTVIGIVLDAGNRAFGQQTFGDEVRRVAGLNTGGQAMQVAQ